jgi:drug/metabolite transporter (DMT)-like permease
LPAPPASTAAAARLTLVVVSLAWGTSWPAMKIALDGIPPFSMRVGTSALAALALASCARLLRRDLRVRGPRAWRHLVVSGVLNVSVFAVCSALAQLATTTSRVSVLSYTMPIWASLFAYLVLGERLNRVLAASLMLFACGLAVLITPLIGSPDLVGIALALATGVCWGAGTVYLKWARLEADPLAISAWQFVVTLAVSAAGALLVERSIHLWPAPAASLSALAYAGLIGSAFAYLLWFDVVRRLPAMTASLGILSVPFVGVAGSVLILGERPTLADLIGFTLILAAAGCVLLAPYVPSSRSR